MTEAFLDEMLAALKTKPPGDANETADCVIRELGKHAGEMERRGNKFEAGMAELAGRLDAAHTVIRAQEADSKRLEWAMRNPHQFKELYNWFGNADLTRFRKHIDEEMKKTA